MVTGVLLSAGVVESVLVSKLATIVVLTGIRVNGVLPSLEVEVGMLVPSAVGGGELASVEVVKGVLESTRVVERVLTSELATSVWLTGILVNGVVPSLRVEVGMLVPSAVVGDEVASVEVVTGVLMSTGVAERVLASEVTTGLVLTGILVNGVLPSLGVEVDMLVPSVGIGDELTSVEVITVLLESTGVVERVLASGLATGVVLTGILFNRRLPSLGVEIGMLLPSAVAGELASVELVT